MMQLWLIIAQLSSMGVHVTAIRIGCLGQESRVWLIQFNSMRQEQQSFKLVRNNLISPRDAVSVALKKPKRHHFLALGKRSFVRRILGLGHGTPWSPRAKQGALRRDEGSSLIPPTVWEAGRVW